MMRKRYGKFGKMASFPFRRPWTCSSFVVTHDGRRARTAMGNSRYGNLQYRTASRQRQFHLFVNWHCWCILISIWEHRNRWKSYMKAHTEFDEWLNGRGEPGSCFLAWKSSIAHTHNVYISIVANVLEYTWKFDIIFDQEDRSIHPKCDDIVEL